LAGILDDDNWKKLGACEIECLSCIDYTPKTKTDDAVLVDNLERKNEINALLKAKKIAAIKPKSEIELMKEQNALLLERLERLENIKPVEAKLEVKISDDGRKKLEEKANELGITFRANIGNEKLLAKIQEIEPEFTL